MTIGRATSVATLFVVALAACADLYEGLSGGTPASRAANNRAKSDYERCEDPRCSGAGQARSSEKRRRSWIAGTRIARGTARHWMRPPSGSGRRTRRSTECLGCPPRTQGFRPSQLRHPEGLVHFRAQPHTSTTTWEAKSSSRFPIRSSAPTENAAPPRLVRVARASRRLVAGPRPSPKREADPRPTRRDGRSVARSAHDVVAPPAFSRRRSRGQRFAAAGQGSRRVRQRSAPPRRGCVAPRRAASGCRPIRPA